MYKCEKHGVLESEWCNECEKIVECDCSDHKTTRFKDLILDCNKGERTITVFVEHCETCGNVFQVNN